VRSDARRVLAKEGEDLSEAEGVFRDDGFLEEGDCLGVGEFVEVGWAGLGECSCEEG
jgi:hypothetical protein